MRQTIGSFEVIDAKGILMQASVTQEIYLDKHGVVTDHRKFFHLGDPTGEKIIPTDDPKVFLKQDGSRLKSISLIRSS